ncbi:aminotransferase class I/II-fold pyridoxal phosphate-dependent enzyme [bacterium]
MSLKQTLDRREKKIFNKKNNPPLKGDTIAKTIKRRIVSRYYVNNFSAQLSSTQNETKTTGTIITVSEDGMTGQFNHPLNLLERIDIKLITPKKEEYLCKGRIMWANSIDNNQFQYGIGFLDTNSNKEVVLFLKNFINKEQKNLPQNERRINNRRTKTNNKLNDNKRNTERRINKSIFKKCIATSKVDYLLKKVKGFFRETSTAAASKIVTHGREMIGFSSCSYLGLNNDTRVKNLMIKSIKQYGTTTCSSPLASGTMDIHNKLTKKIAEFHKTEDSILYYMGYLANQGCLGSIVSSHDYILTDEKSHASIIEGCSLANGTFLTYKHNNMDDLKKQLKKLPDTGKLIVTDGVFSMDGNVAKLDDIYDLAQQYDAGIMVDDAHGIGVLGNNGGGTAEHFGLEGKIDIIMGTFSKSMALIGGYITGKKSLIDYLKWTSRAFIFNLSLPPYIIEPVSKIIDIIQKEPKLRECLWNNIHYMKTGLRDLGFDIGSPDAAIIPIWIKNNEKTYKLVEELEKQGIFADTAIYPIVKKKETMIRLVITAEHSIDDLKKTISIFKTVGKKHKLIP